MQPLPIDAHLPAIIKQLRTSSNLILEAEPGAGKTTRVPPALLEAGLAAEGEVWVLEPRRLAARLAARRVAEERGERLGDRVGYQVRFEEVAGPHTRLRFLTEGVLTRRLLSDRTLDRVGLVVLDEFHERHLQTDLALALLRRLQRTSRPDLRLVVMSATLDPQPLGRFLGECPVIAVAGRQFEVAIEHVIRPDQRELAAQVAGAVSRACEERASGDLLVFLPGALEIRAAQSACAAIAAREDLMIVPLHGDLPVEEQDRAVRRQERRKVILSTNVAESSITIDGVETVIDSGLARLAGHSSWSGLPTLETGRISRASAIQRAGRAGRTRPGRCLRLYTAADFNARPEQETPEILRVDLTETVLQLHALGVADPGSFAWYEAPTSEAVAGAETLLERLGALAAGRVTSLGESMLRLPVHPRQSRMLIEAQRRGEGSAGCVIAALIGERDIRANARLLGRATPRTNSIESSDLLARLELYQSAARVKFAESRLDALGLDPRATRIVAQVSRQLWRLIGGEEAKRTDVGIRERGRVDEESLLISILTGYPDRVARRRAFLRAIHNENFELMLSGGGSARLSSESQVRASEFLVAVDAEERRPGGASRGRGASTLVRQASAIEPEWLIDLFSDRMRETSEARWNSESERVEVVERLVYDALVIDERRRAGIRGPESSAALAQAALAAGADTFVEAAEIERFLARIDFVREIEPQAGLPALDAADLDVALAQLCDGKVSFDELRAASGRGELLGALKNRLTGEQRRKLARLAPERVDLAGRSGLRVNYERERKPWLASRLQDFFGMAAGPRVGDGKVPIVLHLLGPNGRPVQITTDLAGFWERSYAGVRRELSRRYPRHRWPEDPLRPGRT
jgi:ATP-dependent helicase HrpB